MQHDFALELLERERLNLRELIRTIRDNEHRVMSGISHDEQTKRLDDIEAAIAALRGETGESEVTNGE